jgi:hypothetical protein
MSGTGQALQLKPRSPEPWRGNQMSRTKHDTAAAKLRITSHVCSNRVLPRLRVRQIWRVACTYQNLPLHSVEAIVRPRPRCQHGVLPWLRYLNWIISEPRTTVTSTELCYYREFYDGRKMEKHTFYLPRSNLTWKDESVILIIDSHLDVPQSCPDTSSAGADTSSGNV